MPARSPRDPAPATHGVATPAVDPYGTTAQGAAVHEAAVHEAAKRRAVVAPGTTTQRSATQGSAAAIRLLASRGYDATTAEDLADVVGVSRSTFFRRFGSKDDVIFADHDLALAGLEEHLGSTRLGLSEALITGTCDVLRLLIRDPEAARLRFELVRQHAQLKERELVITHRYERVFARFLREHLPETAPSWVAAAFASSLVALHNQTLRDWLRDDAVDAPALLGTQLQEVASLYGFWLAPTGSPTLMVPNTDSAHVDHQGPNFPSTPRPGAAFPGTIHPGASGPDTDHPGAAGPDASPPDTNCADSGHPGTKFPGANLPSANLPSAYHPGAGIPGAGMPGTSFPGADFRSSDSLAADSQPADARPAIASDTRPMETVSADAESRVVVAVYDIGNSDEEVLAAVAAQLRASQRPLP